MFGGTRTDSRDMSLNQFSSARAIMSSSEPMTRMRGSPVTAVENVPRPAWPVEEILKNAPATRDQQFLVPPVLE